jgi:Rrf2 family iron-sulfur cluster assembly transcriptional regulator
MFYVEFMHSIHTSKQMSKAIMSKKFNLALKVLGSISQCSPNRPVTADELARLLDLSVSYVEILVRPLRLAGLVYSVRGPGGGYLPDAKLSDATAGDVYKLFSEVEPAHDHAVAPRTAVEESVAEISMQIHAIEMAFLQNYPLAKITSRAPKPTQTYSPPSNVFKLAPVTPPLKPNAPNSIFDLARFGQRTPRTASM